MNVNIAEIHRIVYYAESEVRLLQLAWCSVVWRTYNKTTEIDNDKSNTYLNGKVENCNTEGEFSKSILSLSLSLYIYIYICVSIWKHTFTMLE